MKKLHVILVLYYTRGIYPLRDTIRTHLYCHERYSLHRYVYVNLAFGFPWDILRRMKIAGVIFHTICLSMRWSPAIFKERTALLEPLEKLDVPKLAMPQDEFIHTDLLAQFLERQRITHLFTCATETDWRKIYGEFLDLKRVQVKTTLTGYIDEDTLRRVDQMKRRQGKRKIDIGYRAWKAAKWLGEHGQHKVRIAEVVQAAAGQHRLNVDISLRDEDQLGGDDWLRFMVSCKATIGVEGGASVLDRDGTLKIRVEEYEKQHPEAGFEEVRDACFPGRDHEIGLSAISPRHFEACMTNTCQILVRGSYNGILYPDRHYIPLEPDYSNLHDVLEKLKDEEYVGAVVARADVDIVRSGDWSYKHFVEMIDREVFPSGKLMRADLSTLFLYRVLQIRDWLLWQFQRLEVITLSKRGSALTDWAYRFVTRLAAK